MSFDLAAVVDPTRTAVLLNELQEGLIGSSSPLPDLAAAVRDLGVVDRAAELVAGARAAGVRVVHCSAENLPGAFGANRNSRLFVTARRAAIDNPRSGSAKPLAELGPEPEDVVFTRYHGLSPMTDTSLDSLLRNEQITTVVVAGASLNIGIPNLVFDAVNRSYQVVVVEDAVAGVPADYGAAVVRNALSTIATIVPTSTLLEIWADQDARSVPNR